MAPLNPAGQWLAQRFELRRAGADLDLLTMEGLRGMAVFLVFLVHYATLVGPWVLGPSVSVIGWVHRVGNAGVDLFFVLSGFLIYGHLVSRSVPFWRYARRRVQRIYPTFLAVLALYLVLSFAVPSQSKLPGGWQMLPYLAANLLLLPGIFPIEPIITVAWSLSYEMCFYLLMPAAISSFALRSRTSGFRTVFLVVAGMLAAALFALCGGPVRMLMFVVGALLFELLPRRPAPKDWLAPAGLVLALLAVAWPSPGAVAQVLQTLVMGAGFFALCWVCFSRAGSAAARLATWLPLRWLGNMSYSYYLIHGLALKACFMALSKLLPPGQVPLAAATLLVPAFLLSLVPSVLLFLWVERPWSLAPGAPRSSPAGPRT